MKRLLPITLLVATSIMAVAAPAASADPHKGEVQIESWSLGAPIPASGLGAGKVSYSDLSVMISLEKSSPLLNLALAEGKHIDELELTFRAPVEVRRAGDDKRQDYLTITLEEVMVSSFEKLANGNVRLSINYARIAFPTGTGKTMAAEVMANAAIDDPRPTDQLSLNFTKISYLKVKLPDVLVSSYSISGHGA